MVAAADPLAWLRESGAQTDVIEGLRRIVEGGEAGAAAWERLWTRCPRGDWLLGIATRLGAPKPALVRAAVACARTALEAGAPETRAAEELLAVVTRWAEGAASEAEVAEATRALEVASARAPSPAVDAALRAALAAGMGVAEPEVLAGAAACAAEAQMMATLDCGMPLVMSYAHGKCAEAVRAAVPWGVVAPLVASGTVGTGGAP